MGLIQNGYLNGSPLKFICGPAYDNAIANRGGDSLGTRFGIYKWMNYVAGIPSGSRPFEAVLMPFDNGGVSFQFRGEESILDTAVTGIGSVSVDISGSASFTFFVSEGQIARFTINGVGSMAMLASGLARAGVIINVAALTQDDVAYGVLEANIDGTRTLRDYLKLIGAAVAGKAVVTPDGPNHDVVFRNLNDTVDAITGEYDDDGNRISVAYNTGD
jgi:hypothetical protein